MIRCGATSISINPDTVISSRKNIAVIEEKIQMEKSLGIAAGPKIAKIPLGEVFFWRHIEE